MSLHWQTLTFAIDDGPVRLASIRQADNAVLALSADQPLVEVMALGHGRSPGTFRQVGTDIGRRLRYVSHEETDRTLRIVQNDETTGLQVTSVFEASPNGVRTWTEATMTGSGELHLTLLSSCALGLDTVDYDLLAAENDWMAESRWQLRSLRDHAVPDIQREPHHPVPRGRIAVTNRGSWSTGEHLPTGLLISRSGTALGWQIEHNGPWHYEIGETRHGLYLLLTGPSDEEHQWNVPITAEQPFTTVPVSLVLGVDRDDAFAALTRHRRTLRRTPLGGLPVIFNDYMNTLMGDPTTEKLLPLIDAAADAGAEYFCIDAGWYAEGNWWSTVGAWQPSTTRFPGGLKEVVGRIHDRGMVPGLWLEPEVVGVNSPLAQELPDDAFLTRRGIRVTEHGRYLLDLRSSAARSHLDATVDRLVDEFGIGFFKLDNNTMTGPGSDAGGTSLGHGLLEHNRALLTWLESVKDRHPDLVLENCGSGALRMDYAMLSRLDLQSTSDQQDPVLYATIAAAAPASVVPEQAGNWAYPRTGTSTEEFALSLVNGVLGRMYLSGHLDQMTAGELALVRSALAAHRTVLADLENAVPFWPLGLPGWTDEWVALGLRGTATYLTLWHRSAEPARIVLPVDGRHASPLFPLDTPGWHFTGDDRSLQVSVDVPEPSARVLRL